ncbi:Predicted small integral membrane protein [Pseudomonas sp. ok272]|uniref:DUF2165 domain-containing protein n=1 Tax=unclassified Pseudomonas TaxID=196821 RepID=UPI0008BF8EC6|nr:MULTISPECIES: DUF2165 domain-containing protein [unclassified Pseudomonas]SEM31632.1 Predicted small integral membrane protein [Pseudomonas sp. ok272]SFM31647.1 Predicted small integral membrane protein [Pseudomonas sp. ok602]
MVNMTTTCVIRRSKIIIALMAGIFGIFIVFSNLTDYTANYEFIAHILSMDTTRGNSTRTYRAVTSSIMHHRFYWMIITLETIFTTCCLVGAYQLFQKRNASSREFHEAKKYAIAGLTTGTVVYYLIFQVILNEWFDMDMSILQWHALEWAQGIVDFQMPALIYLALKNDR